MYVYIHICISTYMYIYINIYIHHRSQTIYKTTNPILSPHPMNSYLNSFFLSHGSSRGTLEGPSCSTTYRFHLEAPMDDLPFGFVLGQ